MFEVSDAVFGGGRLLFVFVSRTRPTGRPALAADEAGAAALPRGTAFQNRRNFGANAYSTVLTNDGSCTPAVFEADAACWMMRRV